MPSQALDPLPSTPPSSDRLGRYRLLTQLGQGGMGAIHLAVTAGVGVAEEVSEFEKLVVIKELKPELSKSPEFVTMFLGEVKLAARLNHANIVQTIEAGRVDDRYFMSMEFLDGQPFTNVLAKTTDKSKVPLRLRLQVLCDVLAALHYAHELKDYDGTPLSVVHCDVSFGNIFITYEGQVKLVDFGVARVANALNRSSDFQGKVRYASPEQLSGGPVDRRADIYSAGILLWEALTLKRFTGGLNSDRAVIEARLRGAEPKLASVLTHVDRELAAISDKALERDPAKRFSTAEEFRLALSGFLARLGPRIDASEISRFMTTEFANERSEVHQIISTKLRSPSLGIDSGSIPRRSSPGHDDVTTVADLSTLIESIGTARSTVRPTGPSSRSPSRSFVGLGLGALALIGLFWATRGEKPTKPLASPAPALAAELAPTEAQPLDAKTAIAPPTPDDPEDFDEAPDPDRDEAKPERRTRASARSTIRSGDARNPPIPSSAPSPAPVAAPTAANAAPEPPRKDRIPSTAMGQELGPRPKAERTGIDSDNPFK